MVKVNTTKGEMDEALLQKKEGSLDNDNETTNWVEYCLLDCDGQAHKTGKPDSPGHFCNQHVHRSAHAVLKPKAGAAAQSDIGRF